MLCRETGMLLEDASRRDQLTDCNPLEHYARALSPPARRHPAAPDVRHRSIRGTSWRHTSALDFGSRSSSLDMSIVAAHRDVLHQTWVIGARYVAAFLSMAKNDATLLRADVELKAAFPENWSSWTLV